MPTNVQKQALRELWLLRKMQPQQPEYSSSHAYLELLADLPWQKASEEKELDLRAAEERLNTDHYGLVKVKQRIMKYLAVLKLKPDARVPVLLFVGPPGVGKTSLASSIAAALDRKFVRISLSCVEDKAVIRGHQRSDIGSLPGRLIEGLKRVGVCNPVMLLDDIDKTGSDVALALLEVLDPEQNKTFKDHYLNVPFDLSKVIFIATANSMHHFPPPLLERMEVIELPRYTPEEKLSIAMRHLIPRVLDQHGLTSEFIKIPEAMVKLVIQRYTREDGVRDLERKLAAAVEVAKVEMEVNGHEISTSPVLVVDEAMLEKVLRAMWENVLRHHSFDDKEIAEVVSCPGVSLGLVWTSFGAEVQLVEAIEMVGKGNLLLTGQLGDVIKESARLALTWILTTYHCGIKRVIVPERNLEDIVKLPSAILDSMEILPAKTVEDVLEKAFERGCPNLTNFAIPPFDLQSRIRRSQC
ncbi:lon protease homolog 2, peroxisomal-like isoform X3 [Tasmannia lanceolata]|uniref:lon protease homolog 2, peroxisomal-like isoform X3 n=1 Tax=Tasmannia lanceolata TaxID=3420 RepID=UPI004063032C